MKRHFDFRIINKFLPTSVINIIDYFLIIVYIVYILIDTFLEIAGK